MPQISIVMPVFNREKYIKYSVESILNQTFKDFEFIIVNDGSKDKTLSIIKSYNDKRIKILNNETNKGIVFSRNRGLKAAQGKYIGMFDSDDIAMPEKFKIQYDFLENNPKIAMVGSWVKWIDRNGNTLKKRWKLTQSDKKIPAIMLFRNYFIQSTVLIRKEAIPEGFYSPGFDIVEDSKMWFDVSLKHNVANIHKYLVLYRVHSENISDMGEKHLENSKKLFRYIFSKLEINPTEEELKIHYIIKNSDKIKNKADLNKIENWLLKIYRQNLKKKIYNKKILRKVIFNRWIKVCYKSRKIPFKMLKKLLTSKLSRFFI